MIVSRHKKEYIVKSYEVDCHGFLRLLTLMNLFQDMADENASQLNIGFEACRKRGLAWVGSNYALQISRFPKIHEHFTIETWPAEAKMWGAVRDFIVRDAEDKEIIKASSQWVLIDYARKRPVSLQKHFPDYVMINERALPTDFPKLPDIKQPDMQCRIMVRFDDIDVNQHVNNAVYPLWASECVPAEFRKEHYPAEIEIQFKKEAHYGEEITVLTELSNDESLHSICETHQKTELAVCRIKWQKATSE